MNKHYQSEIQYNSIKGFFRFFVCISVLVLWIFNFDIFHVNNPTQNQVMRNMILRIVTFSQICVFCFILHQTASHLLTQPSDNSINNIISNIKRQQLTSDLKIKNKKACQIFRYKRNR